MRNIKYKAWHKKHKKILAIDLTNGSKHEDVELLQSTGIKDKNGSEIYEYDVIKINEFIGNVKPGFYIVGYTQGCFVITKNPDSPYFGHYLWVVAEKCEKVKNYFEIKEQWLKLRLEGLFKPHFSKTS